MRAAFNTEVQWSESVFVSFMSETVCSWRRVATGLVSRLLDPGDLFPGVTWVRPGACLASLAAGLLAALAPLAASGWQAPCGTSNRTSVRRTRTSVESCLQLKQRKSRWPRSPAPSATNRWETAAFTGTLKQHRSNQITWELRQLYGMYVCNQITCESRLRTWTRVINSSGSAVVSSLTGLDHHQYIDVISGYLIVWLVIADF